MSSRMQATARVYVARLDGLEVVRFGAPDCVTEVARVAFPARCAAHIDGVPTIVRIAIVFGRPIAGTLRAVEGDTIRVTRSVVLPVSEIEIRVSRSSGPGGQHAQKSSTRVEALLDVAASDALTDVQKRRVVARAGPVLRAVAQDERSQARNRELATERLVEKLRAALAVPRRRVATKPSAKARERRLEGKKRRARVKSLRARPAHDE